MQDWWRKRPTLSLKSALVLGMTATLVAALASFYVFAGMVWDQREGNCVIVHAQEVQKMQRVISLDMDFIMEVPVDSITLWTELIDEHNETNGNVAMFTYNFPRTNTTIWRGASSLIGGVRTCLYAGAISHIWERKSPVAKNSAMGVVTLISVFSFGAGLIFTSMLLILLISFYSNEMPESAKMETGRYFLSFLVAFAMACMFVVFASIMDVHTYDCTVITSAVSPLSPQVVNVWAGNALGLSRFDFYTPSEGVRDHLLAIARPTAAARCRGTAFRTYPVALILPGPEGQSLTGDTQHGFRVATHMIYVQLIYNFIFIIASCAFVMYPDPPAAAAQQQPVVLAPLISTD